MPLTPLDIHNKMFKRGLRGYNEDEVDDFLDEVTKDYENILKERDLLREQVDTLSRRLEQYTQLEHNLHRALVVAEECVQAPKRVYLPPKERRAFSSNE